MRPLKKGSFSFSAFSDLLIGVIASQQFLYLLMKYAGKTYYEDSKYSMLHGYIGVGVAILLLFSYTRVTAIYNKALRDCYRAQSESLSFIPNLKFVFHQNSFWINTLSIALLYTGLPLKWSFMAFADLFLRGKFLVSQPLFLMALLIVLFGVSIGAHLSACEFWSRHKEEKNYSKKSYEKAVMVLSAVYSSGTLILFIGLPLIISVFPLLFRLVTIQFVFFVFLAILTIVVCKLLRKLLARRALVKQLHSECEACGWRISGENKLYASAVRYYPGESFYLTAGKKEYACKLVGVSKKRSAVLLGSSGKLHLYRSISLFRQKLFDLNSDYELGCESAQPKILIIDGYTRRVFAVKNGASVEIEEGTTVNGYTVYKTSAFLRAIRLGDL